MRAPCPAQPKASKRALTTPRAAFFAKINSPIYNTPFYLLGWTPGTGDALNVLSFSKKAMAVDVSKVLASAIANAENNHNLDVDALVVKEASVGKAMTMKRFHTRGRGKSTRILKPFSRLRIVVEEREEA